MQSAQTRGCCSRLAAAIWRLERVPTPLQAAGWLARQRHLCGRDLVVHLCLRGFAVLGTLCERASGGVGPSPPLFTHWPVFLSLRASSWRHRVLRRRKPRPGEPRVEPRRGFAQRAWSWSCGLLPVRLEETAGKNGCQLQKTTVTIRKDESEQVAWDTSKGGEVRPVTVAKETDKNARKKDEARCWEALRRCLPHAPGGCT